MEIFGGGESGAYLECDLPTGGGTLRHRDMAVFRKKRGQRSRRESLQEKR